jgi:hypothetical protein
VFQVAEVGDSIDFPQPIANVTLSTRKDQPTDSSLSSSPPMKKGKMDISFLTSLESPSKPKLVFNEKL